MCSGCDCSRINLFWWRSLCSTVIWEEIVARACVLFFPRVPWCVRSLSHAVTGLAVAVLRVQLVALIFTELCSLLDCLQLLGLWMAEERTGRGIVRGRKIRYMSQEPYRELGRRIADVVLRLL